jgi:predicted DNA-binding protein
MKAMRRFIKRDDSAETMPIASSLPRTVFERYEKLAGDIGVPKATIFRRAVCKYLQDMEERQLDNPFTSDSPQRQ